MTVISKKQIEYIANLARIDLTETEKNKYSKELSKILDYINKLNELETKNIEPMTQASEIINVFRKDENPDQIDSNKLKRLFDQAPDKKDGFIKTRPTIEK